MSLSAQTIVADLVTEHPECASVLQRHRIDFCCRGNVSLDEACRRRGLDTRDVLAELERTVEARALAATDVRDTPTAELVALIVERHHGYLRQALPFLTALATKVARVHGGSEPRLAQIEEIVAGLAAKLPPHLDEEEAEVFPALVDEAREPSARALLDGLEHDHVWIGEQLVRLRSLTDEYVAPSWACRSYRTLFAELEALETDLLRHIHLENHVLLPRFART